MAKRSKPSGAVARGRPARLLPADIERLSNELRRLPQVFGYKEKKWGGALLALHLRRRYGVTFTDRRCRQILNHLGAPKLTQPLPEAQSCTYRRESSGSVWVPATLDKEAALRRIRRLASSELPLEPFVKTLFAIVARVFPLAENQTLLADPRPPFIGYVVSRPEIVAYNERNRVLNIEGGSETSGVRNFNSPEMLQKPIWMHEEIALPYYYNSAGYNEVQRPLRMHHCMIAMLVEHGKLVGRWPMWRSEGMPTWNHEDAKFTAAAIPYITHGLRLRQERKFGAASADEFVSLQTPEQGMVLLDRKGRVLSIDRLGRAIFAEIGVFDDQPSDLLAAGRVRVALDYIGSMLRQTFDIQNESFRNDATPAVSVQTHHTGIALRLRGFALDQSANAKYFVVFVERGELASHRRQRLMLHWGLSRRECEILYLLVNTAQRGSELAASVGISPGTLKTHLRRLAEKLGAGNQKELRKYARAILTSSPPPSAC